MAPVVVAGRRPHEAGAVARLAGQKLEYVQLGPALVWGFSGGSRVVTETVAHLAGPGGPARIDPGERPSDAIGTLLGDVVQTAQVRDSGELVICFAGGAELVVGADADAESWAVAGADGCLIVCLPGGEVAAWTHVPTKVILH
ncbi:DUF6188 family protein [Actinoplanes sp. M2I2]|uniref:DUF6188 family protein n=1 Tax=Actinoplanes sp. M2I2 TaxID=1734444 RepID=UPI002021999A|nr:DUF6188 family protein [Actinoplanes sp. M2I2]